MALAGNLCAVGAEAVVPGSVLVVEQAGNTRVTGMTSNAAFKLLCIHNP